MGSAVNLGEAALEREAYAAAFRQSPTFRRAVVDELVAARRASGLTIRAFLASRGAVVPGATELVAAEDVAPGARRGG